MGVTVTELIKQYNLTNFTPDIDTDSIQIKLSTLNRPALQLTGFFKHFEDQRIQIIGNVETAYLRDQNESCMRETLDRLVSYKPPCVIYSTNHVPNQEMLDACKKYGVPCLGTVETTSDAMSEMMRWLKVQLAEMITVHGVLLDVFGEGVLITGESGIGKSEAALELIKRGHRLVSDDVVEIRKVSDATLIGQAPGITKYFIELRGVGVIDVKSLYGVESVKDTQQIDLEIHIEDWDKNADYDRLGLTSEWSEYIGNRIKKHTIPIRPGRNLAIIIETAAVNYRQQKMGYNAAQELSRRAQSIMGGKGNPIFND